MEIKKIFVYTTAGTAPVLSCILIGLAWTWHNKRITKYETNICLSGKNFKVNSNPNAQQMQYFKNDKDVDKDRVCGKASEVLDVVVEQALETRYDSNTNPEYNSLDFGLFNCKRTQSHVIKLHLNHLLSHEQPVLRKPTKILWKSPYSLKELRYLEKEGSIYVNKSGQYFVSSGLTTAVRNINSSRSDVHAVRHQIFRISNAEGTEDVLLEQVKSVCEMATEMSELTTNMGAVFNLKVGDRIYVTTSHPYYIVSGPNKNYLSIYMI